VFSGGLEPFPEEPPKFQIGCTACTAKDFQIFKREFEWSRFKAYISWRVAEHESEVYVYEVTLPIQEDVAVVSILDL